MSRRLHRRLEGLLVCMGCALLPAMAHAGDTRSAAVVVNTSARTASGSMGTARNSIDSKQIIGCYGMVKRVAGKDQYSGYCFATNSAGVSGSCTIDTLDPISSPMFSTLKDDSYVSFAWTAAGKCTDVRIENYSYWEALAP
jgi:hypothetical protein